MNRIHQNTAKFNSSIDPNLFPVQWQFLALWRAKTPYRNERVLFSIKKCMECGCFAAGIERWAVGSEI